MTETTFEMAVKAVALSDGFTAKELSAMRGDPRLDPTPEYEGTVRAALQAIREVDDETVAAGCVQVPTMDWDQADIKDAFTAMIDSILSQSPKD